MCDQLKRPGVRKNTTGGLGKPLVQETKLIEDSNQFDGNQFDISSLTVTSNMLRDRQVQYVTETSVSWQYGT